jgi:hypothetical protein
MKHSLILPLAALFTFAVLLQAQTLDEIRKLAPGEKVVAKGKVAYSKPMEFDYDKDGTPNTIVMAAELFIKQNEDGNFTGFLQRGLYDIEKKKPIGWYLKRNLLQQPPAVPDIYVGNVVHEGKKVSFDIEKVRFTVVDGGKGYDMDKVIVDDHIKKPYAIKLYEGDFEVFE